MPRLDQSVSNCEHLEHTLIAVFDEPAAGRLALARLAGGGMESSAIASPQRRRELRHATHALSGADSPEFNLVRSLVALSVPIEPARAYAWEFERCHTIVIVRSGEPPGAIALNLERAGARLVRDWCRPAGTGPGCDLVG
jgi:hypothetical protein